MPSATYLKNKQNILLWRERHPEGWAQAHKRQNHSYYIRHKETIKQNSKNRFIYQKEAKVFREILLH
jgi:hypothetical protein